jgi:hypothetical protein
MTTSDFDDAIRSMRDLAMRDHRHDLHLLCQIALGIYRSEPHSSDPAYRSAFAARARCQEIMQTERDRAEVC